MFYFDMGTVMKFELSKRLRAIEIYKRYAGFMRRRHVVAMMEEEADLTPAGAATYFQNFKNGRVPTESLDEYLKVNKRSQLQAKVKSLERRFGEKALVANTLD